MAARAGHLWFKALLFVLLALNAAVYAASGTLAEALDTTAWLVLLVLFELETDFGVGAAGGSTTALVRGARFLAALAVAVAAAGYAREAEWLDAINAALWIAIVAVLEARIRFPAAAARWRRQTTFAANLVYGALGAIALVRVWRQEWFDAYDALLWLAALIVIEKDMLRALGERARRNA